MAFWDKEMTLYEFGVFWGEVAGGAGWQRSACNGVRGKMLTCTFTEKRKEGLGGRVSAKLAYHLLVRDSF